MRRFVVFVASVAIATTVAFGSAGAQTSVDPIQPGQIFNGFVNGSRTDATITMACAGPVRPGQLGHPAAGQTLEVRRGLDLQPSGYLGTSRHIRVDLQLRFPIPHTVHLADFWTYRTQALPTRIMIPCAGDGQAVFTPVNGGPDARPLTVHVLLAGLP
jgi:hypothetical protein